jgi:hypothetical protein
MKKSGLISTFGKPNGQNENNVDAFIKKGSLEKTFKVIEDVKKTKWNKDITKEKLVPKDDIPLMNLHSNKNYIQNNRKEFAIYSKKIPEVVNHKNKD